MGRRKIEIKPIKDDRNRSVTFLKRKGGLFKKAAELSILCSVDVAVIVFGHNKKLYEFSSGDINETIGRYQYYGGAHEHKGLADYTGKKEGDEDEDEDGDMGSPIAQSRSPPDHSMLPPHLREPPSFLHVRHAAPSASPPIGNGTMPFPHRGSSPQPPGISRPASRNHARRTSSNLAPPSHHPPQSSSPQPSYAYTPNPPFYRPQNTQPPVPAEVQPQPQAQSGQPQPQQFQYPHGLPTNQQLQQAYMQDQRRQSMPPAFPQQVQRQGPRGPPQPSPQPQQRLSVPVPVRLPSPQHEQASFQGPPVAQPHAMSQAAKSHSIFTPIDDSRSLLAQHWGPSNDAPQPRAEVLKQESGMRAQSVDIATISRPQRNGTSPRPPTIRPSGLPNPTRTASSSFVPTLSLPPRANSLQSDPKRPRLKVQIPSEQSDGGSATGGSSPKETANTTAGPAPPHPVVLPPPSPSTT
ncbi:resistance to lethality of mkk1p386 overexpression, partial [Elasticomyces elasticus]